MPLHRLYQRKMVSFFLFLFLYTRGIDVVASILWGSGRKDAGECMYTRWLCILPRAAMACLWNVGVESVSTLQNFRRSLPTYQCYGRIFKTSTKVIYQCQNSTPTSYPDQSLATIHPSISEIIPFFFSSSLAILINYLWLLAIDNIYRQIV